MSIGRHSWHSISGSLKTGFSVLERVLSVWLTSTVLVLLMVLIFVHVFLRFIFNLPLPVLDLVEFSMVAITFASLASAQKDKSHLRMDLFADKISKTSAGPLLGMFTLLVPIACFAFIGYAGTIYALDLYENKILSVYLSWPSWLFATLIPIGCFLLCIRLIAQIELRSKKCS